MPLLNYTTKIPASTSIGQITTMLVKAGATKILQEYYPDGRVKELSFILSTPLGERPFRLPAMVDSVQQVLEKQKQRHDYDHAERVAWRIMKDWCEAQLAIIASEMVTVDQLFMPYMVADNGETFYQLFSQRQLQIGQGEG